MTLSSRAAARKLFLCSCHCRLITHDAAPSFEEGDSASVCCYSIGLYLCTCSSSSRTQALHMSTVWNAQGGKWQAAPCVSHFMQDTLSCSSWPTSPGLRWEKRWVDLRLIPLLHSRLSQYIPGADVCRWAAGTSSRRVVGSGPIFIKHLRVPFYS